MYEYAGFRLTSDFTALITLAYVFVFIFMMRNRASSIRSQLIPVLEESKEEPHGKYKKSKKVDGDDAMS